MILDLPLLQIAAGGAATMTSTQEGPDCLALARIKISCDCETAPDALDSYLFERVRQLAKTARKRVVEFEVADLVENCDGERTCRALLRLKSLTVGIQTAKATTSSWSLSNEPLHSIFQAFSLPRDSGRARLELGDAAYLEWVFAEDGFDLGVNATDELSVDPREGEYEEWWVALGPDAKATAEAEVQKALDQFPRLKPSIREEFRSAMLTVRLKGLRNAT